MDINVQCFSVFKSFIADINKVFPEYEETIQETQRARSLGLTNAGVQGGNGRDATNCVWGNGLCNATGWIGECMDELEIVHGTSL